MISEKTAKKYKKDAEQKKVTTPENDQSRKVEIAEKEDSTLGKYRTIEGFYRSPQPEWGDTVVWNYAYIRKRNKQVTLPRDLLNRYLEDCLKHTYALKFQNVIWISGIMHKEQSAKNPSGETIPKWA